MAIRYAHNGLATRSASPSGADAHSKVETFVRQVHHAVAQVQFHAHLRMGLLESRRQRCDHAGAEGGGRADPQGAGRLRAQPLDRGLGPAYLFQHALGIFVEHAAGIRQALAARAALDQPCAQPRFQFAHVLADHHRRHLQLDRSFGEVARVHDGDEGLHTAQLIHIPNHQLGMGEVTTALLLCGFVRQWQSFQTDSQRSTA